MVSIESSPEDSKKMKEFQYGHMTSSDKSFDE